MPIKGVQEGDYFHIRCNDCGSGTKNEYLGGDPSVPHFKSTCIKCGSSEKVKLSHSEWDGLPLRLDAK